MAEARVLAVDLGATSVRVASVDLDAEEPDVEVIHRWSHQPVEGADGHLRWQWDTIVAEVERGLRRGLTAGPVASIGVDGWAVDYGLIDADGRLVAPPYSYHDKRTGSWREVVERVSERRLYAITGIQLLRFNTIFQLAAHDPSELARAHRMLLLPDLLVHHLVDGWDGAERSNASTTALLDVNTGEWSTELLQAINVDTALLPPLHAAGEYAGRWSGVPVHIVGSHDTASAFIAAPGTPRPGTAVVSCGSWVLVGMELDKPILSQEARRANLSNEGGAFGGIQLKRNVVGFWLLERCRAAWGSPPVLELIDAAAEITERVPIFDATDPVILSATDVEQDIRRAAGLPPDGHQATVTRCILESIASAVAQVADDLAHITGVPLRELLVVGGATRIGLMNNLLARATGVPVTVGSPEAAALGNAAMQGVALGKFSGLDEARQWIARRGNRVLPPTLGRASR